MGYRRMAIRLGMEKPFKPDKEADFITSVIIISVLNLVVYSINQIVGIIIWLILALVIIVFISEKIKQKKKTHNSPKNIMDLLNHRSKIKQKKKSKIIKKI